MSHTSIRTAADYRALASNLLGYAEDYALGARGRYYSQEEREYEAAEFRRSAALMEQRAADMEAMEALHALIVEAIEDETNALATVDLIDSATGAGFDMTGGLFADAALDMALTAGIKRTRAYRGDIAADRMARACRSVA